MASPAADWDPFGMSERWDTGELKSTVAIEPYGRWSWYLVLSYDCVEHGSWFVLGSRSRAERTAERKLAAFRRCNNRRRSHRRDRQ